jgi:hypothetical protein
MLAAKILLVVLIYLFVVVGTDIAGQAYQTWRRGR